jgi:hypothetical protein
MINSFYAFKEAIKEKQLIIFGSGRYFRQFSDEFPELVSKISFVMDNDSTKIGSTFTVWGEHGQTDIEIKPVSCMLEQATGSFMVLFCAAAWKEMKGQLDSLLSYEYTYFTFPLEIDYLGDREHAYYTRVVKPILSILERNQCLQDALELTKAGTRQNLLSLLRKKKIIAVSRMPIILTPRCSLRCKECNNLMWAFDKKENLEVEKILHSVQNIVESVDFIGCFELIGGEPFLADGLGTVLEFLVSEKKVMSIEITTNATIIPKEPVLSLLQDKKVLVRISNYGNVVNQKPFIECMKKNGIHHEIFPTERWISPGGIEKRNRTAEQLMQQYYKCDSGYLCKPLWEDKVYPCARAASLAQLGIYADCPYVDVSGKEKLQEKLIAFYQVPSCGACDYCDMALEQVEYVEPAVQRR